MVPRATIVGVLQARVSSSRLPGKVLRPLLGEPMILRQLQRLRHARHLQQLVVATSTHPTDDPLWQLCHNHGIACYRGSLDDVLDRVYRAAEPYRPTHVVRLTGDCPLTDPQLIDTLVDYALSGDYDYASNCLEPSWPDGLDAEVIRWSSLHKAWIDAILPSQREHVTPYLYQHPELFRIGSMRSSIDLSHLRWTVDEPADFELVERIYRALYKSHEVFGTREILDYLNTHPELTRYNTHHTRNEGLITSQAKDKVPP